MMNATKFDVQSIDADKYEERCKSTGCNYEVLSDDKPIKMYFDIDLKGTSSPDDPVNFNEDMTSSKQTQLISEMATNVLSQFLKELVPGTEPSYAIKSANSPKFVCSKTNTEKYAMSLHIIVNNIVAMKADQHKLIKKINSRVLQIYPDLADFIGEGKMLFDEVVYDKGRKLRSVYSSKPNESRPFKIEQGTFEETCVTAFIPNDASVLTLPDEPVGTSTITSRPPSTDIVNKYKRRTFELGLADGLLDDASIDYEHWRNIGFALKHEFGNAVGWELFDNFSKLAKNASRYDDREKYDVHKNREFWDGIRDNATKPVKFGSLVKLMKEVDLNKYKDIQKQVNNAKKAEKVKSRDTSNDCEVVFKTMSVEFEKTHAKIVNRSAFVQETGDGTLIRNKNQILVAYEDKVCGVNKWGIEQNFIKKWLVNNENIRKYDDMNIYPHPVPCPPRMYNLWRPFAIEKLHGTPYTPNPKALEFYLHHIRILCNHNEIVYTYIVKWIAQMLQYPGVKSIMPTFIGKPGTGKSSLILLLTLIMGEDKILETAQPSRDVWGQFNAMMSSAFLVHLLVKV